MQIARLAVPFNLFATSSGEYGVDAFLWRSVRVRARLALLVRRAEELVADPPEDYVRLDSLVGLEEQIRDLRGLGGGLAGWARMHWRWKIARLLLPLRDPGPGWEYEMASRIIEGLALDSARGVGLAWLPLSVDLEEDRVYTVRGEDRVYTWLLREDEGVYAALRWAVRRALRRSRP